MLRWCVLLFALFLALPTAARSVPPPAEPAPVRVGLWYDPARLGSGFDVQVAGGQLFVVWYTYRADGSSVWYTAQGAMDGAGELDAPLLLHRWQDGRHAGNSGVGRLRLTRVGSASMRLRWTLDGATGEGSLVPLVAAPDPTPIDRTGAFYEPARGGYGLTLSEAGALLMAAYYAYDASGAPTWVFGTNGTGGPTLTLVRYRGACPACAFAPSTFAGRVTMTLVLDGETRLSHSIDDPDGVLPGAFRARDVVLTMLTEPASARPRDRGLVAFADADAFERFMEKALLDPPTYLPPRTDFAFGGPPLQPFFRTSVEQYGDEPDTVVRDGEYVYAFDATSSGTALDAVRVMRLDAALPDVTAVGRVETRASETFNDRRRLLIGPAHLVAVTSRTDFMTASGARNYTTPNIGATDVQVFDRRAPTAPRALWHARFDGNLVTARRVGDDLLLVLRSAPPVEGYQFDGFATRGTNAALLASTPAQALLPRISVGAGAAVPLLAATDVRTPPLTTRTPSAEYLTFVRIALDDVADREALAIAGGVETVHAARESGDVYVLTTPDEPTLVFEHFAWPRFSTTDVHRIGVRDGRLALLGTGVVEGQVGRHALRPSTRIDEYDGRLRIVTTVPNGRLGRHRVTVLEPTEQAPCRLPAAGTTQCGVLRTVASLPNLERPQPLDDMAQTYAGDVVSQTHFVGERLYTRFFRFCSACAESVAVVDFAAAGGPRLAMSALAGFPRHVIALDGDVLLGVDTDSAGVRLSLIDARVPDALRVLDEERVGQLGSNTAVVSDPRALAALAVDAQTTRVALPVVVVGEAEPSSENPAFPPAFTHRALYAFDVVGRGAAARFARREALVGAGLRGGPDPDGDRALLSPAGAAYYAEGRFFSAPWGAFAQPFGPR